MHPFLSLSLSLSLSAGNHTRAYSLSTFCAAQLLKRSGLCALGVVLLCEPLLPRMRWQSLCCTLPCYSKLYYTIPCYTVAYHTILHDTALHYTTPHYTTLHCTVLHCTALYYTELQYTTPHGSTLHCTALHPTSCCCSRRFAAKKSSVQSRHSKEAYGSFLLTHDTRRKSPWSPCESACKH